jgi:tight adherence protein C
VLTPPVIAACLAGAVLLIGLLTTSVVVERSGVRESLRRLEGYQIQDVRDQEMLAPISERVLNPLMDTVAGLTRHFTPEGYRDQVAHKLVLGGNASRLSVDQILVWKLVGLMSGLVWLPLILFGLRLTGFIALMFIGVLWAVSFFAPDVYLSRAIERRQHEIAVQLPDILDLLVISVEAGLGFDQALERTTGAVPGTLSDEFRRMLRETRFGSTRADALRALNERCDVSELRAFILAMLQADTFGVSISRILRSQADEMRVRRRLRAQQQAQKAPVKMLFPMVFCIFPSIFVVILGPAFIQIAHTL